MLSQILRLFDRCTCQRRPFSQNEGSAFHARQELPHVEERSHLDTPRAVPGLAAWRVHRATLSHASSSPAMLGAINTPYPLVPHMRVMTSTALATLVSGSPMYPSSANQRAEPPIVIRPLTLSG